MTTPAGQGPKPISWQNLLNAAADLLNTAPAGEPPSEEHVRRAISNVYYAVFHALAVSNADTLIGRSDDSRTVAAWSRAYRGLDHATALRELQRHRDEFSSEARRFADIFQNLQNRRHSADYDHNAAFTGNQATMWLEEARLAMTNFLQTDRDERAYIATLTLIRGR